MLFRLGQFRHYACTLLGALFLLAWTVPASAEVIVTFYSKDMDQNYPHTFLRLQGTLDDGRTIDTNVGFTARRITPAVLMGPVPGRLERVSPGYLARSQPRFRLRLDDAAYRRLDALISQWRKARQPSYDLNRRNCIHFVMDAARALGLRVNLATAHVRDPTAFLTEIMALNPQLAATMAR